MCGGQIQDLVFVVVRERIQETNKFAVIGTRAWLQTLDECVRTCGDPTKLLGLGIIPTVDVPEHWETTLGGARQRRPKVVKRRAGVMHYVADDDTQAKRWLCDQIEANPKSALFAIDIGREFCNTWAKVGDDLALKRYEMFMGPDDFRIDALQASGR